MVAATVSIVSDDERSPPPRKRIRPLTSDAKTEPSTSGSSPQLYAPFRALGIITNHVPIVVQTRSFKGATEGPKIHLLTCLGRSWALWEGGKMSLLFAGK